MFLRTAFIGLLIGADTFLAGCKTLHLSSVDSSDPNAHFVSARSFLAHCCGGGRPGNVTYWHHSDAYFTFAYVVNARVAEGAKVIMHYGFREPGDTGQFTNWINRRSVEMSRHNGVWEAAIEEKNYSVRGERQKAGVQFYFEVMNNGDDNFEDRGGNAKSFYLASPSASSQCSGTLENGELRNANSYCEIDVTVGNE